MNKQINRIIAIIAILIVISFLLPPVSIGASTKWKPDAIFLIFLYPFFLLLFNSIKNLPLVKSFFCITGIILAILITSGTIGNIDYLGVESIYIHLSFLGLVNRVMVFSLFLYISYHQIITEGFFLKLVTVVFTISLLWGVGQYLNISWITSISSRFFALTELQQNVFLSQGRIVGTAGHIIAWGGCSMMMFYFFYFIIDNNIVRIPLCSLAGFNVLMSGSRSSIISLVLSFIIILLIKVVFIEKRFIAFLRVIVGVSVLFFLVWFSFQVYFQDEYNFIVKRFDSTEEAATTSGRGMQMTRTFNFMNRDYTNYVFGIGQPALENLGFMEVEPVNLLASSGIIGVFFFYLYLFLLVKRTYGMRKTSEREFLFILGVTFGYLIFSFGFFFFKELYMYLPFWWITGYLVGRMYRKSLAKE